jgi:heme oxygenase
LSVNPATISPSENPEQMRFRLKRATAHAHARLDQGFASPSLQSCSDYSRFLRANAAALLPLEAWLETSGVSGMLPDWNRRRRSAAILADLDDLCAVADPLSLALAPLSAAATFGVLYVLEGSRLGARYLAATCAASTDTRVRGAMRYLRHGEDDRLWPSFVVSLERSAEVRNAPQDCIAGALEAFAVFQRAQDTVLTPASMELR